MDFTITLCLNYSYREDKLLIVCTVCRSTPRGPTAKRWTESVGGKGINDRILLRTRVIDVSETVAFNYTSLLARS